MACELREHAGACAGSGTGTNTLARFTSMQALSFLQSSRPALLLLLAGLSSGQQVWHFHFVGKASDCF